MEKYVQTFLDALGDRIDSENDPVSFCRGLFIKRSYHRLIAFYESSPNNLDFPIIVKYWYLMSLIKTNRYKESEIHLNEFAETPKDSKLLYVKGICRLKQLDFNAALDNFTDSFKLNPYFIEPMQKMLSHHLITETAFDQLISGLKISEEHRKALKEYASLSWLYHSPPNTSFEIASKLLKENPSSSRAIVAYISCCLNGNKKAALFTLAQRLSDTSPDSHVSMFAAGCHMILIGRSEAARSLLWASLRRSPSFAPAWLVYAISHWIDGDSRTALNIVLIAARAFPSMELLQLWAGRLNVECNEMPVALAHYKRCKIDGYVMNEIGCVLLKCGRIDEAIEILDKAITVDDEVEYYINCAAAHRRANEFEESIEILLKAESKDPENINVELGLAFSLHLFEQLPEAIEKYTIVLKLAPDNLFARGMLDEAVTSYILGPMSSYYSDDEEFDNQFEQWEKDNGIAPI